MVGFLNSKNKNKTVKYAKISPKMVNPRDIAGNSEEEEETLNSEIALAMKITFKTSRRMVSIWRPWKGQLERYCYHRGEVEVSDGRLPFTTENFKHQTEEQYSPWSKNVNIKQKEQVVKVENATSQCCSHNCFLTILLLLWRTVFTIKDLSLQHSHQKTRCTLLKSPPSSSHPCIWIRASCA